MKSYKTMTPEQSAYEISILMGRPVRYSRNIYADPDIEEQHLKVYDRRGCAARICDDGAVVLYGKPEHNRYFDLLKMAVYQVMVEKGPEGLLTDVNIMRMVAERSVRFADGMSDVDLRAFCMSCSDGNGSGIKTAADILHVAFKGAEYPEGLERAVCDGLKTYRYGILSRVRDGSDETLIKDFAIETASSYSGHRHLHWGRPRQSMNGKSAFWDLSYADVNIICDIDIIRNMARDVDMNTEIFLKSYMDELRFPVCILKDVKHKDNYIAVFDIRTKDGAFVSIPIPSPQKADIIRRNTINNKYDKNIEGYIKINMARHFLMSPEKLGKILSFQDYRTGETNIIHVRRAGEIGHSDIIDILNDSKEKEAPENQRPRGRVEGFSGTSIPTLLPSTLNAIAKVVNNFKNPKNIKDFNKNNDVVISIHVGIPQETVPGVIVREDTYQSFISEKSASPEKNLTDPATKIKENEKDFVSLRLDDIKNALTLLRKDVAQGSILMPRDVNGVVFRGSDTHYLFCKMATTQQWKGCPVFIPESALKTFGLSACEVACPAFSASCGENVYNLMDTDMSPLLKKEILMLIQEKPKAVPAEVVTQVLSFCPDTDLSSDQVRDIVNIWASSPAANANEKIGQPLEDILYPARKKVEKHIDPRKALQKYGFPEAVVTELIDKGDVCYKGPILTRPDNGISTPQQRIVNIRLRILDGEARLCTPAGNPVGNSLINALKDVKLDAATLGRVDRFFAERKAAVQAPEKSRGRRPGE